ncbi:MAG TPA: ROK family protein [Candidatus Choladocola avistercoris]|nr:ROK family protein [Candidatus Choladocola avistercoris]
MRQSSGTGSEPKRNNKIRTARFISLRGVTSKTEISAGLKLSMPTTLQNVKALIDDGIVEETGEYESTGGRRAKALSIRSNAGYAAGVDITNNHITMVMVDAKKEMTASERIRIPYQNDPHYYDFLTSRVFEFLTRQGIDCSKISGIGFSLPGIVDREQHLLLRSHTLRVQNVSFRTVGETLGYPFGIENDANSAAYAELGKETENAVYLSLSNTVGGAVCLGYRLYPGENFKSGEFGHMVIEKNGRECYCGKQGCMDAYCSARILEQASGCSLEKFFEKVRQKTPQTLKIWNQYLDDLAVAVTNLRMIFDCRIVLGGYVGGYLAEFLPELSAKVMKYNNFDVDTGYLSAGKYKLNAAAYGAALGFIEKIFENI